jgi:hypothetical protein
MSLDFQSAGWLMFFSLNHETLADYRRRNPPHQLHRCVSFSAVAQLWSLGEPHFLVMRFAKDLTNRFSESRKPPGRESSPRGKNNRE